MDVGEAVVLVCVERRAPHVMGGSKTGLGLDRADHDLVFKLVDQHQLVGLAVTVAIAAIGGVLDQGVGIRDLLLEQTRLLHERDDALAVCGAQRRRPAPVLLE